MIAYLRRDAHSGVGGEDDVRGLIRQVAVDALPEQGAASTGKQPTALHLVTRKTALGKIGNVALRQMNVMTRRTRHVRRLETLASLQQLDLTAMNVEWLIRLRRPELQMVRQRIPYLKRKHGRLRKTNSTMTQRTQIQLPVAR